MHTRVSPMLEVRRQRKQTTKKRRQKRERRKKQNQLRYTIENKSQRKKNITRRNIGKRTLRLLGAIKVTLQNLLKILLFIQLITKYVFLPYCFSFLYLFFIINKKRKSTYMKRAKAHFFDYTLRTVYYSENS